MTEEYTENISGKFERKEKEMKILIRENIPCWYELSWNPKVPAIILKIHKDFIKHRNIKLSDLAGIVDFNKNFSYFGDFKSDFRGKRGAKSVI